MLMILQWHSSRHGFLPFIFVADLSLLVHLEESDIYLGSPLWATYSPLYACLNMHTWPSFIVILACRILRGTTSRWPFLLGYKDGMRNMWVRIWEGCLFTSHTLQGCGAPIKFGSRSTWPLVKCETLSSVHHNPCWWYILTYQKPYIGQQSHK